MLKAENISKSYGKLKVLDNVDFYVEGSKIVSIVGKSGSGKSTLLHTIGTLDKADAGKLYIKGDDISTYNEKQLARFRNQHIGFIFQFHHLLEEFDAVENVMIPALIKGDSKTKAKKEAETLLDYLGLKERLSHKPSQLSGGEQQRVAVARALINKPSIIFADEPTGNLDAANSADTHQLFVKLKEDFNQTFIIVTHNLELADLSDEVYLMDNGKLIKQ